MKSDVPEICLAVKNYDDANDDDDNDDDGEDGEESNKLWLGSSWQYKGADRMFCQRTDGSKTIVIIIIIING